MHAVLVLFRPLPNVGIQNLGMWGMYNLVKAYRSVKNPLSIAESRTGKPAMVTLKIQPDCSTLHDTTLWANIFVHSHLVCGTDSFFHMFMQVPSIFQRRKSDANKQDSENMLNLTCQAQSTPKTIEILTKVFCTSGPNLVVLARMDDELSHRQAQNGVNFDFEVKFDLEGQDQSPPKNHRYLNQGLLHLWSKFGDPSLNRSRVIARTSKWLTHRLTHTHIDTHTHRRRRWQYPKAKTGLG